MRAEQRLEAENSGSDHGTPWQFAERLRYRLTANVPLPGNVCDEHRDVGTASLIEVWIDEAERRTWFLFEAGGRGDSNGE